MRPMPIRFALEALAAVAPEAWPASNLRRIPPRSRLTFKTNAAEIWSALREETAPPKPRRLPEPAPLIVWRQDFMARFKPLSTEEAMMWDEAVKGVRFSVLCEMVATFGGDDDAELRAASYLKDWVDMGMLAKRRASAGPRQIATALAATAPGTARRSARQPIRQQPNPFARRRYRPAASPPTLCRTAA